MVLLDEKNRFNGNTVLVPEYVPDIEKQQDKKEQYKKNKKIKQKNLKKKFKTLRNIIIAFIIGVVLITRYVKLYGMQKDLNNIKNQITEVEKESENLKVELVHHSNLSNIEKEAREKLKMEVPKKDVALYADLSYNNFKNGNKENIKGEKHKKISDFFYKLKKVLF